MTRSTCVHASPMCDACWLDRQPAVDWTPQLARRVLETVYGPDPVVELERRAGEQDVA